MHKLRLLCNAYNIMLFKRHVHTGSRFKSNCSPCSWDVMMSCWAVQSQHRPVFTSLVKKLFVLLDHDSNYSQAHLTHIH